jgi:hypothetical protein
MKHAKVGCVERTHEPDIWNHYPRSKELRLIPVDLLLQFVSLLLHTLFTSSLFRTSFLSLVCREPLT